jgi:molecular chaperone GrpE (heat shock protein)
MEVVVTEAGEENKVLQELRPGFTLFGKVLRPAHVKVGKKE